jgi:hypothetical protein
MYRTQAVILVVVLLSAPLALLGRSSPDQCDCCNGFCCLPHTHQSAPMHHPDGKRQSRGLPCHHCAAEPGMQCAMQCGNHRAEFGYITPLAPTILTPTANLSGPNMSARIFTQTLLLPVSGFLSAPFIPPRL